MHLKIVVCKSGGHFVQVSLCQSIILPDKILCIVHTMSCCASIVSHLVRGTGHSCMFDGNLETRKWPTRCKQHSWTYFLKLKVSYFNSHFNGLMQERRNSSALTMELRLSCTSPSICLFFYLIDNISALVLVMAWRLTGIKPLPQPMMTLVNQLSPVLH